MLLRKRFRLRKNQKGMTLIELMAVVVILGILATVAGAAVVNSFSTAKTNSDESSKTVVRDAVQRYVIDKNTDLSTGSANISASTLVSGGYLVEIPKNAKGTALDHVIVAQVTSASGGLTLNYYSTTDTSGAW